MMLVENWSAYNGGQVGRITAWTLSDLTPDELDVLTDSLVRIENMPTDMGKWQEGVAHTDTNVVQVFLWSGYRGHALYADVWEALVSVTRHEVEHLLQAAREGKLGIAPDVAAPSSGPVSTAVSDVDPGVLSPEMMERIATEIAAKRFAQESDDEEAKAEAKGRARLDEWRGYSLSERDAVRFGMLKVPQWRWG